MKIYFLLYICFICLIKSIANIIPIPHINTNLITDSTDKLIVDKSIRNVPFNKENIKIYTTINETTKIIKP